MMWFPLSSEATFTISLHFLYVYLSLQCAEEQKRVPESLYPFTFNPKMSLMLSQVTDSTQKSPPLSTPRSKLRTLIDDYDDTKVWRHTSLNILFQLFNKSFHTSYATFDKDKQLIKCVFVLWR